MTTPTPSESPALKPCPFCGCEVMVRFALWPSDGDRDSIIHADPEGRGMDCGMISFDGDKADNGVSVAETWNRRPSEDSWMREAQGYRAVAHAVVDALGGSAAVLSTADNQVTAFATTPGVEVELIEAFLEASGLNGSVKKQLLSADDAAKAAERAGDGEEVARG